MNQPFSSFNFKVELFDKGSQLALFQEVSGLSVSINTIDFQEGGVNYTTHKLICNTSYGNVTLKRGLIDNEFAIWINDVVNGRIRRRDIIITINDESNESVSYKLINTLPVKWNGPNLNAMQDSIALESIELAVEGIDLL